MQAEKQAEQVKKRLGISIEKPRDVIRLINKQINLILKGDELSISERTHLLARLKAIAYASLVLLKAFESADLADRVKAIEEKLGINDA